MSDKSKLGFNINPKNYDELIVQIISSHQVQILDGLVKSYKVIMVVTRWILVR